MLIPRLNKSFKCKRIINSVKSYRISRNKTILLRCNNYVLPFIVTIVITIKFNKMFKNNNWTILSFIFPQLKRRFSSENKLKAKIQSSSLDHIVSLSLLVPHGFFKNPNFS